MSRALQARDKMWSGADQNGDNLWINIGPICGSVITVALRLWLWPGWVMVMVRIRLGLRIVAYKLLEKVTKCRSVT